MLPQRKLGPFTVSAVGLGCMNLSHAYAEPPSFHVAKALLLHALDSGVTHFDTAALYGFGVNEDLVGEVLSPHRSKFILASKGGLQGVDGKRVIDGRPEALKRSCELSLQRLRTDVIDLYYLHRWDKQVPIEDSIGALSDLVHAGKVLALGLSEVSAETLRRAHAVHPIAAVQTEYSLWTRNAEIAVLNTCREIGASLVAFSPLARAWLTGKLREVTGFSAKDIRRGMPRFQSPQFESNLQLLDEHVSIAREVGCTPAQLAIAWLLAKAPHVLAIPGTRKTEHFEENLGSAQVSLSAAVVTRLDTLFAPGCIAGNRYPAAAQAEIDTEEFA